VWILNDVVTCHNFPAALVPNLSKDFLFNLGRNKYIYKSGLGNAHPALCSTFLQTSYSIIAVTLRLLNISLNSKNILLIFCAHISFSFPMR
jgi:hypothetical protein